MNPKLIAAERAKAGKLLESLDLLGLQRKKCLDQMWDYEEQGRVLRSELTDIYRKLNKLMGVSDGNECGEYETT